MMIYCATKFKPKKKRKPKGEIATKYRKLPKPEFKTLTVLRTHPRDIDRQHIPSLQTSAGNTNLKETLAYSGERTLLGIAVLHKSCLQPVFSQKEAEEIARMRR